MNMIIGIVGSSRKGKVTDQIITKCLEGVEKAGRERGYGGAAKQNWV